MAETILNFLRFGADPSSIAKLPDSEVAPFLPSLALAASISPSLASDLLPPLISHPDAPMAFSYASIDFSVIAKEVLDMEQHFEEADVPPAGSLGDSDMATFSGRNVSFESIAKSSEFDQMDECFRFEMLDERERAKLAILSLRRQAVDFSRIIQGSEKPQKVWYRLQKCAGSMWNSAVCLPQLNCLLPIAASLCSKVLQPEHLIWGLLNSNWGFFLLCSVLLNNPHLVKDTILQLSEFLHLHYKSASIVEHEITTTETKSTSGPRFLKPSELHMMTNKLHQMHTEDLDNFVISHYAKQSLLTILYLSKTSLSWAQMCREMLAKNCIFAGLVIYITTEYIHDELSFLSKVVFSNQKMSEWILQYLSSAHRDSYLLELITVMESTMAKNSECEVEDKSFSKLILCGGGNRIRETLLADAQIVKKKQGWCGQLHAHLRLYCVLIRTTELQPTHDEIDFWLKSLISAQGDISEQTKKLAISFFCLVPALTSYANRPHFHKSVSVVLNWKDAATETMSTSGSEEFSIWFAVQLFLRQFSEIAMVVREVLGMHIGVQNALLRELHDAAAAVELISEPLALMRAVAGLRPKGPIASKTKNGYRTLKCLEQLLSSGHFSRNGVDVSETILHCISISAKPIHPLLVQIIQAYVDAQPALIQGKGGSQTFKMQPLPRAFLEDSFMIATSEEMGSRDRVVIRQALVSYYMLCRERFLRNTGVESTFESSLSYFFNPTDYEGNWWPALLVRIPYMKLLHHMERNLNDYEPLFSQWVGMVASLFPERLRVPDLIEELVDSRSSSYCSGLLPTDGIKWTVDIPNVTDALYGKLQKLCSAESSHGLSDLSMDFIQRAMQNALTDILPVFHVLDVLHLKANQDEKQENRELIEYYLLVIKELVPKLLDPYCMQCLQDKFCKWFTRLNPSMKQAVLPKFVEVILDLSENKVKSGTSQITEQVKQLVLELHIKKQRSYKDFVQQPLVLLACKIEVYRTPLLSVLLDILSELLIVNRRVCLGVVPDGTSRDQGLKSDDVSSALTAQDSAICQVLLEACLLNRSCGDDVNPGPLFQARKKICGFLSSFLETNHLLLKLLHFQGYNPELISMMVEGVPVMVKCLEFAPELLQQQQESKQIFAVILMIKISCAYVDIPDGIATVKKVVSHVANVQKCVCGSSGFMLGVLEALAQCVCSFPVVATEVVEILQTCLKSCGPVIQAGPPRDPSLHEACLSAFKTIVHQKVLFGRLPTIPHCN